MFLPVVPPPILHDVAARILGATDLERVSARVRRISGDVVNPTTHGVYRLDGRALRHGRSVRWGCVLKIVVGPGVPTSPTLWNYWRREPLAYGSPWLSELGPKLRAARCYRTYAPSRNEEWLFLEAVRATSAKWDGATYVRLAGSLGRFAAQLAGGRAPDDRWLSRGFLSSNPAVYAGAQALTESVRVRNHPLLVRRLPRGWLDQVGAVASASLSRLRRLERLPQTLCHFDLYPPNLLAQGQRWVAIDWSFVGQGQLGMDLGQLLANLALWRMVPAAKLRGLRPRMLKAYRRGLGAAARQLSAAELEECVNVSAAARAVLFVPFLLETVIDRGRHDYWRSKQRGTVERTLRPWAEGISVLLEPFVT